VKSAVAYLKLISQYSIYVDGLGKNKNLEKTSPYADNIICKARAR
jgi:hypothetical protein